MIDFLPATRGEMEERGWAHPGADFVLVSGDPYVDHPSFGTAVIGRVLERAGYKVCVLAQPDWKSADDFRRFGRPRLGFLVTSGSVDSMVANYTANRRPRRTDNLAPGGRSGSRPDRATIVYSNRCREAYKDVAVILGGLEASLRRLAHYDYWDNKVRRSILLDSKADLLVYGMGERAIVEIADALNDGFSANDITWIPGTVYKSKRSDLPGDAILLPSYEALAVKRSGEHSEDDSFCIEIESKNEKQKLQKESSPLCSYNESFILKYDNNEVATAKPLAEQYANDNYVVQNPPQAPLSSEELDAVYDLPFTYDQHPMYNSEEKRIPALNEIQFSIAHVRGCYGNCSFCAITSHQGRTPTARSISSVVKEAKLMTELPGFKGYIHDLGGSTANITAPACDKMAVRGACKRKDCLWPQTCKNLKPDHGDYLEMLRAVRSLPKIKKVFIRSGIRYDLVLADEKNGRKFIEELAAHHVSGILKVAPEHTAAGVLRVMHKPAADKYETFAKLFKAADDRLVKEEAALQSDNRSQYLPEQILSGDTHFAQTAHPKRPRKPQYLLPYFISAHPGCTLTDAMKLSVYIETHGGFVPDQIQDFYPTPGTLATCIYYTGRDPFTGEEVYIPGKNPQIPDERKLQRAILHKNKPENREAYARAVVLVGSSGVPTK
jgi:uncharacterized radical SAM protein YgiQ